MIRLFVMRKFFLSLRPKYIYCQMTKQNNGLSIHQLRAIHRALISFTMALGIFLIIPEYEPHLVQYLYAWLAFCCSYIILSWITFYTMPIRQIIRLATIEDGSRLFVFLLILVASFACLFAVLLLIISHSEHTPQHPYYIVIAVGSMLASWVLVHTIYTFHYAHLYYTTMGKSGSGLLFPGEEQPDYLDFAYFSFVMGCTFQVSDVQVTSKRIRHVSLFHGLLSFALNTFVVALTINIIAGLIN